MQDTGFGTQSPERLVTYQTSSYLLGTRWENFPASHGSGPCAQILCSNLQARISKSLLHGRFSQEQALSALRHQLCVGGRLWLQHTYTCMTSMGWDQDLGLNLTDSRAHVPRQGQHYMCLLMGATPWHDRIYSLGLAAPETLHSQASSLCFSVMYVAQLIRLIKFNLSVSSLKWGTEKH